MLPREDSQRASGAATVTSLDPLAMTSVAGVKGPMLDDARWSTRRRKKHPKEAPEPCVICRWYVALDVKPDRLVKRTCSVQRTCETVPPGCCQYFQFGESSHRFSICLFAVHERGGVGDCPLRVEPFL